MDCITKILATLGPASSSRDVIAGMIEAGTDMFRFNFSHGTHDEHRKLAETVRACANDLGRKIPLVQDLQGPKIRVDLEARNPLFLEEDREFVLTAGSALRYGDDAVRVEYAPLCDDLKAGELVLFDDGKIVLEVLAVDDEKADCVVREGGLLADRKGVNLPGTRTSLPPVTEKDLSDLEMGLEIGFDWVALSFVESADDIRMLRKKMAELGKQVPIIAKLERPSAIENLNEILDEADAVMVARGDLGIEMNVERVPVIQKQIIKEANSRGVTVITATQMLESMMEETIPTRAEVTDVANAVLDGTDIVMLSGETSIGNHPAEAVRMMDRIIMEAESFLRAYEESLDDGFEIRKLGDCKVDSPLNSAVTVDEGAGILLNATVRDRSYAPNSGPVMERAGPRDRIYFKPESVKTAIVTCGGLCPGLNDVIRGLVMVLWYRYGVKNIIGLRYGYEGLVSAKGHEPMVLNPEIVEDIHQDGGTILGSSRGPQNVGEMVDFLVDKEIDILFTIGGDGTQRGALAIVREIQKRGLGIAVVGVPKTIDNDISCTERTFGFETAVAMSQAPINSAHMEAKGAPNGIGLVKLMGRESGFVAAYAALASSDVNLLLVPEVPFTLEQVTGFLEKRLGAKDHAVVVVAEGAGQDLMDAGGTDASGNRKLGDIGVFLKEKIADHFKGGKLSVSVKYIDPSYTIRSAPATADDSVFCFQLAANAVHAAMSGRTGMVVALWNGQFVHVPMEKAVEKRKKIDPNGLLWQSVLDNTGQEI